MATRTGNRNALKQVATTDAPPWRSWSGSRHARAIRWIETYFVAPKGYGYGQPLKLASFQKEWLEAVYQDGIGSAIMLVPRGNGKSTFLAAVAAHALFDEDDSGAPQVPIIATTLTQAFRATYGVALAAIAKSPTLSERSLIYNAIGGWKIKTPYNDGEMFPISNSVDGLQGLDPSLGVVDEIGFMPIESWDSLLLASGKRPQSLIAGIGTPGFDQDSALWHLRSLVYTGVELPGFHYTEYSADDGCDIRDEEQWAKANPALAEGYKNIDSMRSAVELSPESHFRIFQLGQWVEGVKSWLGEDGRKIWQGLTNPYEMEEGAETWAGVDVALKHDSTAIVICQRRGKGVHVKAKIWLPRKDGRLDVSDAMQHLRELATTYSLQRIAYDPRFFDLPAQQLLDEGLPMVEFPQVLERLSPAVGTTFEMIKRGELTHDDDPMFEAQVLAAVPRFNERGFTLAKAKSERIDAAVAMCMGVQMAMMTADQPTSEPWAVFA